MPVHTFYVFDRKGKTLFTKRYGSSASRSATPPNEEEELDRQKLVFGMLLAGEEVVGSLSPENTKDPGIHSVQTGASTLHTFQSNSGLRFALYTSRTSDSLAGTAIRAALKHIYNDIWINSVTRSPLFDPVSPNVKATSFEQSLDDYLNKQDWFR